MEIVFAETSVTITGARPGNEVILFGNGIAALGPAALLTREVLVQPDEDRDGAVTFQVRHLPPRSVWVGVDAGTGDFTIAAPGGKQARPLVLPSESWRANVPDIRVARRNLEILLVRPRLGSWTMRAIDGGVNDADGRANRVQWIRLAEMEKSSGDGKGPPFALPNDLVVIIDPWTLEIFASEAP